jgi:transcriptional regulator with PAS, ATPase and Fis domain
MVNRKAAVSGLGEWFEHLPCSITVVDRSYKILYMNAKSADVNRESGGKSLIGKNLMDCHPPEAQAKLKQVMTAGKPHVYTTERRGVRKMVYQGKWKKSGRVGGLVELYFELPKVVENHVRT